MIRRRFELVAFAFSSLVAFLVLSGLFGTNVIVQADETSEEQAAPTASKPVSFHKQIVPIFQANCYGCHQPAKALGEYEMTSFENLLKGGVTEIEAIIPGEPEESHLLELLIPEEGEKTAEMPKGKPALSTVEVGLIRTWIAEGAVNDSPQNQLQHYDNEHPPVYTRPPVITSVDFAPDGSLLAVAGFHEILLVKPEGELVARLVGMSEQITSVSFSPDGTKLLATGGLPARRGEIQVWNVAEKKLVLSKFETYDTLFGGSWSPDGKLISFGGTDKIVRAIDAKTGEQVLFQGAHDDWVRDTVFSKEGTYLASAGRDMTCKLTEVATERFVDNITSITPGALKGGVAAIARHPERDEIVVGSADGIPKVYRMIRQTKRRIGDDANQIRYFPKMPGRIQAVDVSTDGKRFVAGSALSGVGAVNVYSFEFDSTISPKLKSILEKVASSRSAEERKVVEDYRTKDVVQVSSLPVSESGVYAVSFHPDGSKFAAAGSDGLVRIVETETGKLLNQFSPAPITESAAEDSIADLAELSENVNEDTTLSEDEVDLSGLIELNVEPATIQLSNVHDYAQILVSAKLLSGDLIDVTRLAKTELLDPLARISPAGLVRPKADGKTLLKVSLANKTVDVPVAIKGVASRYAANFIYDVNPLLTKMGCNQGTCHGADKGKNGFKLSLRGYDPEFDVRAFTDDLASRRTNIASADNSLMLLKATGTVPHVGGQLMRPSDHYYSILKNWISAGAHLEKETPRVIGIELFPKNPTIQSIGAQQQFRVVATYEDGAIRDVTRESFLESGNTEIATTSTTGLMSSIRRGEAPILARYEGAYTATTLTVMGDRSGFEWQEPESFNEIDRLVAEKWQRMKIAPSELTSDAEFLRRVYLDLTGLPPTSNQVREFLADKRPTREKRNAIIDQLVGNEEFVDLITNKWGDMLQVNRKFLGEEGAKSLRAWIRNEVKNNTPYDQFVRNILTATGSNKENPAASYFKILRNPEDTMENTTHLFLSVRFNCNKCHDHPFERWTQDQYYETAAFFSQVNLARAPESKGKNIGGTAVEGAKPLFEVISDNMEGTMKHARTGAVTDPAFPFECDYTVPENATRRQKLASWITSPNNEYFARSYVNRLWGYLFGKGIIEPIDDIRAGNPPTNPELLDYLTKEFVASGFDVQHVYKLICKSRVYQLSVVSNKWNEDDQLNYSHATARRLPAEVLFDAVHAATGAKSKIPGVEPGTRAAQLSDVGVKLPDGFLNNFGRPARESSCECERSSDLQLGPVMALISGPTVGNAISDPDNGIAKLVQEEANDALLVNELFLRMLNRPATVVEVAAVLDTFKMIDEDHQSLSKSLQEREVWWKETQPKLEQTRLEAIEAAKADLEAYQKEIASKVEQARKEQAARVVELDKELKEFEKTISTQADTWADKMKSNIEWFPLNPESLNSSNGDNLVRRADRAVQVTGEAKKGTYTLTFKTRLKGITGIRLEALAENGLTGNGPGLTPHGNFVVTEFQTSVAPLSKPKELKKVNLQNAKADFSQAGFDPKYVINGQERNQQGWAVTPHGMATHWMTLESKEPFGHEEGSLIQVKIHQYHNAEKHRLARFRISVTTDQQPIGVSLPEPLMAILSSSKEQRTEAQKKSLDDYYAKVSTDLQKRRDDLAKAKAPLPEDPGVTQRKRTLENVSKPVPLDRLLAQLRIDLEQSQKQVQNKRLTVAQDLAWALINSPSFLFNR